MAGEEREPLTGFITGAELSGSAGTKLSRAISERFSNGFIP